MENLGLHMLDQALHLAEQEKLAMENENYADAIAISRQRGQMTSEAWDFFTTDIRDEYRNRLLRLKKLHEQLKEMAIKAHARVQASLVRNRQEKRRMCGYQRAVSQAIQ